MALVFSSGSAASGPRSVSRILDAARDVLSRQGYPALTVEAVAMAAGVGNRPPTVGGRARWRLSPTHSPRSSAPTRSPIWATHTPDCATPST
ncbi:helix-turn-helix domain-containing protein [Streptomyces sp. AcE210]|uniref:helix-turn-helix domain-containing protein n=1 Tax=Streptomyces sp. AcE210 TaxID=2292703 RepID=UPI001F0C45F0|nr:helix-turn-helix domain-containing protein [Streptomyces sp. AcE210]